MAEVMNISGIIGAILQNGRSDKFEKSEPQARLTK